jgi:hypothetical protein
VNQQQQQHVSSAAQQQPPLSHSRNLLTYSSNRLCRHSHLPALGLSGRCRN